MENTKMVKESNYSFNEAETIVVWGAQQILANSIKILDSNVKIDYIYPDGEIYPQFKEYKILEKYEDILKYPKPFVLIAKSELMQNSIKNAAEILRNLGVPFSHIHLYTNYPWIDITTMQSMGKTKCEDIKGNVIDNPKNASGNIVVKFLGNNNVLTLGAQLEIKKSLEISFKGSGSSCVIERWASIESLKIDLCSSQHIHIGEKVSFGENTKITFNKYFIFDTKTYEGILNETNIDIGAYVLVNSDVIIYPNNKIGKGSVVKERSFFIEGGNFEPFSLIEGYPAKVTRKNVSWVSNLMAETKLDDYYSLQTYHYKRASDEFKNAFIFGCCVSRMIADKSKVVKVLHQCLQSPINTMFEQPLKVELNKLGAKNNSDFKKLQVYNEFQKNFFEILKEKKNDIDYFIFDIADLRFGYYETISPIKSKFCATDDVKLNLDRLGYYSEKNELDENIMKETKACVKKFLDKLFKIIPLEKVLFFNIPTAHNYIKDGVLKAFNSQVTEIKTEKYLAEIEEYVLRIQPKLKYFKSETEYTGSSTHAFGISPYHYLETDNIRLTKEFDEWLKKIDSKN